MRIALIVFNLTGKGTYRRAFQFGKHLAEMGHSVSLLATAPTERIRTNCYRVDDVEVVEFPDLLWGSLRSGWDPYNVLVRIRWLASRRFDIVHAFESRPTVIFPALYAARRHHIPLVMDWADWFGRGGSVEERSNPLVRMMVRPVETFFENSFRTRAGGTTVICNTLRQKALGLGIRPESLILVPNGSDLVGLKPLDISMARQRIRQQVKGFIIGYVGSIFRADAGLMAEAFNLVCETLPEVRLLVIGYGRTDIRSMVRYPHQVIQTGPVREDELNDYLASCDICWLPLRDSNANRGRWPLKLNDYMAVGRPTVATAVGDVRALFEDTSIGALAPDRADRFAAESVRLLGDQPLREAFGRRARQVAETRYDWATLTCQIIELYERLLVPSVAEAHG